MGSTLLTVCVCVLGDHFPSGLNPPAREGNGLAKCNADDTRHMSIHFHPIDRYGVVYFISTMFLWSSTGLGRDQVILFCSHLYIFGVIVGPLNGK